jgi:hypothetical protein
MKLKQLLLKNKPRSVLLALGAIELLALLLLALVVFGGSTDLGASAAAASVAPPPRPTINLQFLQPYELEHYLSQARSPFRGIERPAPPPAVPPVVRRETPRPPPPPPPKQIIVVYRGLIIFDESAPAALVDDRFKGEQRFLRAGDQLYDYTITEFDAEEMTLEKNGNSFTIPRSQPTSVGQVR